VPVAAGAATGGSEASDDAPSTDELRDATGKPETGKPETGEPETGEPETGKPETGNAEKDRDEQ